MSRQHLGKPCNHLQTAIEKLAPAKIIKPKKAGPPWMSAEPSQLQRKCNALFKRYGRTKNSILLDEFLQLRKKTNELVTTKIRWFEEKRLGVT